LFIAMRYGWDSFDRNQVATAHQSGLTRGICLGTWCA